MKKVLIIAYDFPPYVSVGGLRPYNWFKYFKQFDIEPIVVTRQWENKYGSELDYIAPSASKEVVIEENEFGTIIRAPYFPNLANKLFLKYGNKRFKLIRKIISAYFEFFQYVFPIGTKRTLYVEAQKYLKTHKVDAIIATGDPFVLFHYARKLSKKNQIPWLADYRDPWSHDMSNNKNVLQKYWYRHFEKRSVDTAAVIITVSDFVANKIKQLAFKKEIKIFTNGYDPELVNKYADLPQNNKVLTIAHAGSLYKWHPIEVFWEGMNELISSNEELDFTINFYGLNNREQHAFYLKEHFPRLSTKVNFINRMPNAELLSNLAQSNVLLLFNYYSFMGTKIYDYLGIKRKILFCFDDDEQAKQLKNKYYTIDEGDSPNDRLQAELIEKTQSGIIVKDKEDLKVQMNTLITEFNEKRNISSNSIETEHYSRVIQIQKLSEIIKTLSLSK